MIMADEKCQGFLQFRCDLEAGSSILPRCLHERGAHPPPQRFRIRGR